MRAVFRVVLLSATAWSLLSLGTARASQPPAGYKQSDLVGANCPKPVKKPAIDGTVLSHAEALASSIADNRETTLRSPAFTTFVEQDLNYLFDYESWVTAALTSGCAAGPGCAADYGNALVQRVQFDDASGDDYKNRFGVERVPANAPLTSYGAYYQAQKTCAAAATSMTVCLCSYGLVAKHIFDLNSTGAFSSWTAREQQLLSAFVQYNGNPAAPGWTGLEEGTACAYARVLLETLGVAPDEALLAEALAHEQALWSVPPNVIDKNDL